MPLPKEENLNILSQNIYRKNFTKGKKTYFFVQARLKKIQYVRQKTKLLIGNFTKTLYQHYFRIRLKQTSGKVLIERIG